MMDGALRAVEKSQIEQKKPSKTSLMPIGLIKGPEELQHIVSYLMTLRTSGAAGSFIDLLAGGDLKDHFETTGNWSLSKDGVVQLQPREGEKDWLRYGDYLWLKNEYQNFQCEFQYKHQKGGNSGLYFNVTDRQKAVNSVIEVQIRDSAGEKVLNAHNVTGGILPEIAPRANATKPAGEWNQMSVTSVNGEVTVRLNGVLVNNVNLSNPKLRHNQDKDLSDFRITGCRFGYATFGFVNCQPILYPKRIRPACPVPTPFIQKSRTCTSSLRSRRSSSRSSSWIPGKFKRVSMSSKSSGQISDESRPGWQGQCVVSTARPRLETPDRFFERWKIWQPTQLDPS